MTGSDWVTTRPTSDHPQWEQFVDTFLEQFLAAHPPFAVAAGRHEFDGQLPDWSASGIRSEVSRLQKARATAESWSDLDSRQRFERDYLVARIDAELFVLDESALPFRNPLFYADALDPSIYVNRNYAPPEERCRAFANYLAALPDALSSLRSNLSPPLPTPFAELAAQTLGGLAEFCRQAPGLFGSMMGGREPDLGNATHRACTALEEGAAAFAAETTAASQRSPADESFRLGSAGFARMLWMLERVDTPLDDIAAAGQRELERNHAALREACARYRPGLSPRECMTRLQAQKPIEGPVAGARRQLTELRRFLAERELVNVPAEIEARVEEAPPHQRWNSAYIEIPGPFERELPAIYYIAPPDPSWTAEERAAYVPSEADLLFISAHEVWPGHFLQFLHSNRVASPVARLFVGYGFAEGWAHYSEEMIWEAGFRSGDPAVHLGQIQNALLRNVRLLVALGLHAGPMSLGEAERLFQEEAYQDPASSRQQAARGTFDPGYLLYTLGKLMFRKLRTDWQAATGGGLAEFHNALLALGGPPLALARRALLGDVGAAL
jgi:hypothetical protein